MRDETSSSRQEFIEDDNFTVLIKQNEPTIMENIKEDNKESLRESKRQRTSKSFGDDFQCIPRG